MGDRLPASVVLVSLVLLCGAYLRSANAIAQSSETILKGNSTIAGVVANERREPMAHVLVQAFRPDVLLTQAAHEGPPLMQLPGGSAYTDVDGRFRIASLAPGEYLLAAAPASFVPSPANANLYGTTFYPSTLDARQAVAVVAASGPATPIEVQLVRVRGARVSGRVVSLSGAPAGRLDVRLFQRFGGFGSASVVGVVGADGRFETARVPPGWYELTIGEPLSGSGTSGGDFAHKVIKVEDSDIDGLSLVLGPGASIAGRIVPEPGVDPPARIGLRAGASPAPTEYTGTIPVTVPVSYDGTFQMSGLSGVYVFGVRADREPAVEATRIKVDGVESRAGTGVELAEGAHDVVVFVAPRQTPSPSVARTLPLATLIEQFRREKVSWRQFEIAKQIAQRRDPSVLPSVTDWLTHEDRHLRGNAAFIFGALGDPRGFAIITEILDDRSDRPEGQGIPTASSDGRYHVARQIAADRYYAAHLLGDLRDPRGVSVLVPLLKDREVNSIVPWALGQIGDPRAIAPLIDALGDDDPSMRVLAIYALETLNAKEALPRLTLLLDDHRKSNFGGQVSVADAAKEAIAKLR